jgi:hypothetical protein
VRSLGKLITASGVAALLAPSVASAQPTDQRAAAEALFEQGRSFLERGDFAEACPKFAESLTLDPAVGTMLWLADCYASNGQTASAWAGFKEAASVAARQKDSREKVALAKVDELERRLSRLVVVIPPAAEVEGLDVRRDGIRIGHAEWGSPVPLDPGVHTLAASAPGRRPWSTSVQVVGSRALSVTIPVLEEVDATPAPAQSSLAPSSLAHHGWGAQRIAGSLVGGIGVVGVAVGTGLSFAAKSSYDKSNAGACNAVTNACTHAGLTDRSEAEKLATGATIAMAVGAASIAGGVVLFFTVRKHEPPVAMVPIASPHGGSLVLSGAF